MTNVIGGTGTVKGIVPRLLILLFPFIQGCVLFGQNDFIESRNLGETTLGHVGYTLYQTGIDNYRYDFYLMNKVDTTALFQAYLNDAAYSHLVLSVHEETDTIKVIANRNLGKYVSVVHGKAFVLMNKDHGVQGMRFTIHPSAAEMPQLMVYNGSDSLLTDQYLSVHRKIWALNDVSRAARALAKKGIKTFTIIEEYPNDSTRRYTVRFGELLAEHQPTIAYYRVDNRSGQIEKMALDGTWVTLK